MSRSSEHHYRLGFRADVEGLRAVAILLVVAAHANIERLAGGFIGVDVFYVLSGYLITGLLLQEIAATNRLRLSEFYARRLRRLLPGLLVMLVCVFALGSLLIAPTNQPDQAKAGIAASFWVSNLYFAFSRLDYFAAGLESNLFLHTWSLGVEEQFYLVWPLILGVLLRTSINGSASVDVRRLRRWLAAIFAISLAMCVVLTPVAPRFAFYLMPTRAWEFALGALVFLKTGAPQIRPDGVAAQPEATGPIPNLAGWLGLGLIVATAVLLGDRVAYPGAWALLPSLGTAAVLAACAGRSSSVGRLLASRPLQEIGHVSYAWYLWHWPVFLLGATVMDVRGVANRFGLVLLSFVLAYFSTRYVEAPIRSTLRWSARPGVAVGAAASAMVLMGLLAAYWHTDAERRLGAFDARRHDLAHFRRSAVYLLGCDEMLSVEVRPCSFGADDAPNVAVAIGDSIAMQWFPAMQATFVRPGWRLVVMMKSGCPMVDEPLFYALLGREFSECARWREAAVAAVAELSPTVIVVGSSAGYEYSSDKWREGAGRVLQSLSAAAERVYLLRSTPQLTFDGPSCVLPRTWLQQLLAENAQCIAPAWSAHDDEVFAALRQAADRFENVVMVDLNDVACPNGECRAERNGMLVFRDSQHLTAEFVESAVSDFASHLDLATSAAERLPSPQPSSSIRP
jgi:peptidoglycan/LPS O-acetylase OafA/YrhL